MSGVEVARIAVLTFTEVVRDPRVTRHVEALRGHHQVVTCGKGPVPDGVAEHFEIPAAADHLPTTPAGLAGLALRRTTWAYGRLPSARAARQLLVDADFDLIISNDIAALPVALDVAGGRPVVADLHEYAPREMEEDWRWRLMIQPFAESLCQRHLPQASAVTTVAEGIAAEYRAQYGIDAVTVTNASDWRDPSPRPVGSPIRAVHSGMATPNRHIDEMIVAADSVAGLELDLYLVPSTRAASYLDHLREMSARTPNVRVLDPVPMQELPAVLDSYDLGIYVLAPTSFNNLHALPNKFFDFVQSGLGVVIGPSPEMSVLTEHHGLGLVLSDFAPQSLRQALESLDAGSVAGWKAASCRASGILSSQYQAERLRAVVNSLVGPAQ